MAERGPFLTEPYGAYLNREVPREDAELTHVGPGTPCGEYLRRSWHPIAFSVLRDGIRAVQAGRDPRGVALAGSRPISTYCQDTVLRVPPAATREAERQLLIDIGRRVLDGYYVKNPPPGMVPPAYALV